MDIRDILKSSRSPSPPVKTEASAVDQPRSPERLPSVSLQVPLSSPGLAPPSTRSFPVLPPLSPRLYPSPEGNDTRHNSLNINNANQQAASRLEDASQAQPYGPSPAHHVNHSPQQSSLAAVSLPSNKRAAEDDDLSRPAAKKRHQQKWSPEEDSRIIELRGSGMKWAEIKNHLPGRTEIGCRLHYQNYLEKRGSWNDEMKTKLARVYERLKQEMWQRVANELQMPWRAVEAMHWAIGDVEMARRANVTPFVISAASAGPQGEGNGRIAQAARMNDSTIYFEASDVTAMECEMIGGSDYAGPVSTFGAPICVRAPSSSIGSGQGFPGYEGGDETSSDESKQRANKKARGSEITLPSISDLEGVSTWTARRESRGSLGSNLTHGSRLSRGSRGSGSSGGPEGKLRQRSA